MRLCLQGKFVYTSSSPLSAMQFPVESFCLHTIFFAIVCLLQGVHIIFFADVRV